MDRPASKRVPHPSTTPAATGAGRTAATAPAQKEVFDGLLLALLARKRLLILVGEAGSDRGSVYRNLIDHIGSDGALVLPVTAEPGMQVDDLIRAAGESALPADDAEERNFDALVEALEERLELAGAGLLAVDNAGVLAPPVLDDLIELTRSETPAGRFLQVLLSGTADLERALARPGLADSVRELGVIYRTSPGAAPSVVPGRMPPVSTAPPFEPPPARPAPSSAVRVPPRILAAPTPAPVEPRREPANDWDGGADWPNGAGAATEAHSQPDFAMPPPRRRAALFAGAAITTLVLMAGAGAAVFTSFPDALPAGALSTVEQKVRSGWSEARAFVDRTVGGLFDSDSEALALAAAHPLNEPATSRAASPPVPVQSASLPQQPARILVQPVTPPPLPPVASLPNPPAVNTPPVGRTPTPPSPSQNMEAAPGSAALPPLEEAPPAPGSHAAPPTAVGSVSDGDPGQQQRIRALVEQARRQMAGKRLTTPPGDNAFETVQQLRQLSPNVPEAKDLLASMEETYRRWAALAERDGNSADARRFYERALIVSPDSADLRARADAALTPVPEAEPGLGSREAAVALLRRPADLARALQGGASPDTRVGNGKTLLMVAAEEGLADAVKLLMERRARTDLRTADGATAVMYAAWGGHEPVVAALADSGADLDATNDDGKTALMAASARGQLGVVQLLLQRGVAVDRTTANGWSALMYAANNGHDRVTRLLVERGANPYRMDTNGNSALTLGALQGHLQVVEALKPR